MLLKENYSKEYLIYLLKIYSIKYQDIINQRAFYKLSLIIDDGLFYDDVPSELTQIYHEFGLMKSELDYYTVFKDELLKIYNDLEDRSIVDVCAGIVPQLSKELAKVTKKDVLAVDQFITCNNDFIPNLFTIRGVFNEETTLTNRDLLIGLHPCNTVLDIVKKAAEYNIDFAIAICDCYSANPLNRKVDWINLKNKIQEIVDESDLGEITFSKMISSPFVYTNKNRR